MDEDNSGIFVTLHHNSMLLAILERVLATYAFIKTRGTLSLIIHITHASPKLSNLFRTYLFFLLDEELT